MGIEQNKEFPGLWWTIKFFMNPNQGHYPCPVIVIYEQDWRIFARWPSWETEFLPWAVDRVLGSFKWANHTIEVNEEKHIQDNEYAFAISENQMIIGNQLCVVQELKRILVSGILDIKSTENITAFLTNS